MGGDFRRVVCVLVVAAASACLSRLVHGQPTATAPAASQPAVATRAPNPHWSKTGCQLCHKLSDGRLMSIQREDIDDLCWQCHDGRRARKEVHPVGRLFAGDQVTKPEAWPAPAGKLGCVTCHDILLACKHPVPRPAKNTAFLRPVSGEGPMAFCAACHVGALRPGGGRLNVHLMLDGQRRPIDGKCHYCHQDSFELNRRPIRTGDPQLRGDGVSLCIACHSHHVDYFEPGHIGHMVPKSMRTRMLAAEPLLWPSSEILPQSPPDSQPSTRLPLESGNRIVCATCHNPHQQGTFPRGSVLDDGAMRREDKDRRMQFRGLNKELCHACHD